VPGDQSLDFGEVFDRGLIEIRVEGGECAVDFPGFSGKTCGDPGFEVSVEEVNLSCAEGLEHPPGTRCGEDTLLLVDDDGCGLGDTKRGHAAGEGFGSGEHVRERGGVVRMLVDVEEESARDVLSEIAGVSVDGRGYAYGWESGVEDDGVGIVQARSQPCGFDEGIHSSRLLGRPGVKRNEHSHVAIFPFRELGSEVCIILIAESSVHQYKRLDPKEFS